MKYMPVCPICGNGGYTEAFSAFDFDSSEELFQIVECDECGLAITRPELNPEEISKYYKKDYYGDGVRKFGGLIESLTRYSKYFLARKIISGLSKTAKDNSSLRILDIGCGRATLLRSFRDMGHEAHGIERDEFPDHIDTKGLSIYRDGLQELNFSSDFFDVVVIWHVLEHLHEPIEILAEAYRILRPGGMIVIAVPNFSSFQSRWFRSRWFHLDLPRHLYHFGVDNLCRSLTDRGFAIKECGTCSLEQNLYGFIQSCLNYLSVVGKPNEFYRILRKQSSRPSRVKFVMWGGLGALLFPLALIEYVVSCVMGTGASAIVFAEKKRSD